MQHGVGEDGVEFSGEIQFRGAEDPGVQSTGAGRFDLFGAGVDGDDVAADVAEANREGAVAAAEIENALAGLRVEELEDGRAELGDESRVAGVLLGVPLLIDGHDSRANTSR